MAKKVFYGTAGSQHQCKAVGSMTLWRHCRLLSGKRSRPDGVPPRNRANSDVLFEVWVREVIINPGGTVGIRQLLLVHRRDLLEAVQVELPHKAGEIGGLKGIHVFRMVGMRVQDLPLEQQLVDDDGLALAVPEDGPFQWVVHQPP